MAKPQQDKETPQKRTKVRIEDLSMPRAEFEAMLRKAPETPKPERDDKAEKKEGKR